MILADRIPRVSSDDSIIDAMKLIDQLGSGFVMVTEGETQQVLGVVSDGDLRRALIAGSSPVDSVGPQTNNDFQFVVGGRTDPRVFEIVGKLGFCILVNQMGEVYDIVSDSGIMTIPILEPWFAGKEAENVNRAVASGWVSSIGPFVTQFEHEFARFLGVENAITVTSGTTALELALRTFGIGLGDKVLVPDLTFAATANAVIATGATPVFVDVDHATWNSTADQFKKKIDDQVRAIMPVHLYGNPCDLNPILTLGKEYGLRVIEDCAEAIGSKYRGSHVGVGADAAAFSFFGNKTITTGEGGMLVFSDIADSEKARILRSHGMSLERRYWHEVAGYNFRMTNLQAALGVAQLENVELFLERKRRIANLYVETLQGIDGIRFQQVQDHGLSSHWLVSFCFEGALAGFREEFILQMQRSGIEARPGFYALSSMPAFSVHMPDSEAPLENATSLARGVVSLPSSPNLSDQQAHWIAVKAKDVILKHGHALGR